MQNSVVSPINNTSSKGLSSHFFQFFNFPATNLIFAISSGFWVMTPK